MRVSRRRLHYVLNMTGQKLAECLLLFATTMRVVPAVPTFFKDAGRLTIKHVMNH